MPKKLHTNPKAQEARERKETAKKSQRDQLIQQVEAEKWSDEGATRTELRKAEAEAKKRAEAEKRAAKKAAADRDAAELAKTLATKAPRKVTASEMLAAQQKSAAELRQQVAEQEAAKKKILLQPAIIEENVNQTARALREAEEERLGGRENIVEATGIDDALNALSVGIEGAEPDRHPEKRVRAAWKAYEEEQMPVLKSENPSLKFSQLKQMLFDQWKKSPDNPLNQTQPRQ